MRPGPIWRPDLESAFFFLDQNFAFAGVIRLPNDAFLFHPLHQRCCAVIADLQPALNVDSVQRFSRKNDISFARKRDKMAASGTPR